MKPGDDIIWAVVFLVLGGLILTLNEPTYPNSGWFVIIGAVSCGAGLFFTYRTVFTRKERR